MLLVIDIGNTNIVSGLFDGETLVHQWRISSDTNRSSDEYGLIYTQLFEVNGVEFDEVEDIMIASVVPSLAHTIPSMCERYLKKRPLIVGVGTKTGINIKYDNPKEVGADRIVNAVAGFERYGGPLILVDIGTAISFDVMDEGGNYLGGAIAPGIGISSDALFMRTAKLPKVELTEPSKAIGKNTVQSMQSGIVFGYIGLIDGIIERIIRELDRPASEVKVVGTGGFIRLLANQSKYIQETDAMITLDGLRILYEKNKREPR
ncbi:MAG: type III pantothenate kinase [Tissierellia bacterium]|nr:type III pantothenate kinase [Tissierellia bacterium]